MGEYSEMVLEGGMCSHCGVCFPEHGHPVLCTSCFDEDKGESQIPKATNEEY